MNQNIIDSEQFNVESRLNNENPTYESVIMPSLRRMFEVLEKTDIHNLPVKLSISKPIDIYAEALTAYFIKHPYINLPMKIIAFIILYHPFMLNMFQQKHNFESWKQFLQQLIETIKTDYEFHPASKQLLPILEVEPLDPQQCSSFTLFHYLMGFTFNLQTIAQKPSALKPHINELLKANNVQPSNCIIISINASYNIKNKDSIIMYSNVPKSKQRIINESTIEFFNSITQSPVKQQSTTAYDILNLSFEQLSNIPSNYTHALVVVNYNDTTNYKNNHYTLAYFGKQGILERKFADDFICFKVIRSINLRLITYYLQESFYNSIYTNNLTIDELKRSYIQLMNCVSSTFNRTSTPEQFVSTLQQEVEQQKLINQHELKYFKIYISKILKLPTYDLTTVVSYVLSYIYPDLLTSSSEL